MNDEYEKSLNLRLDHSEKIHDKKQAMEIIIWMVTWNIENPLERARIRKELMERY